MGENFSVFRVRQVFMTLCSVSAVPCCRYATGKRRFPNGDLGIDYTQDMGSMASPIDLNGTSKLLPDSWVQ